MPTLNVYFVLYTDGASPHPTSHPDFHLTRLDTVPVPSPDAEFFGPFAQVAREKCLSAQAAFLLHGQRTVRGGVGEFFSQGHAELAHCIAGRDGFAIDLLKGWPMPFAEARELPPEPLAEDLFSVSFQERDSGGFRARTFGLAKLDQAEVSFDFVGSELMDDAGLLCAHLADYAMTQSRRVGPGQSMTFGFDRLVFEPEGEPPELAPLVSELLPPERRPRTEVLRAEAFEPLSTQRSEDLSAALRRAVEQRLLLEEHEVPGEAPHQALEVRACPCVDGPDGLRGWRDEPASSRDSGWTFTCKKRHGIHELRILSVGEFVQHAPQTFRYLALPPGSSLEWYGNEVTVHCGPDDEDADEGDPSSYRFG